MIASRVPTDFRLASVFGPPDASKMGFYIKDGAPPITGGNSPVPPSEIPPSVDANYNSQPSDLPFLSTGGLDFSGPGVDFEIMDIPSITGADSPTFI